MSQQQNRPTPTQTPSQAERAPNNQEITHDPRDMIRVIILRLI
jgi:hypothetical protein